MNAAMSRVCVTAAHVMAGKPCHACECPVALALYDALGDPKATIEVDTDVIMVHQLGAGTWFAVTPIEMTEFIVQFDAADEADRAELAAAAVLDLLQWELEWERQHTDA